MRRYLIGRDPRNIKHFTQWAYDDYATRRSSTEFWCAFSGIEQAMWDIAGKSVGLPVHMLIGGKCRARIRVYANGWGGGDFTSPQQLAERAQNVVEMGFTAMKFDPFPGPWRTYVSREVEDSSYRERPHRAGGRRRRRGHSDRECTAGWRRCTLGE